MNTTSSPESYRYCMFFCSVRTRGNFSPARKVLSTTEPLASDLSLVRMNAPPLPGLTCMPLRNWLVETTSAIGAPGYRTPPCGEGPNDAGGAYESSSRSFGKDV